MPSGNGQDRNNNKANSASPCSADEADKREEPVAANKFTNDGSFLEMFKRMQEATKKVEGKKDEQTEANKASRSSSSATVKRRKVLAVGAIKRQRKEEDAPDEGTDAWTQYMNEVKKYKEKYGDDSDKNRPLVK
ncbi:hypothetical protein HDE_08355 [Halotydeus destructor]|nr:hypothetical protein HDE_08355 [Halotydeus destructor]